MKAGVLIMIIVIAIAALVIISPMLTIWSINTLFGTNIDLHFTTWSAALWLMACVGGGAAYGRNK
jgi:hypothetical protein